MKTKVIAPIANAAKGLAEATRKPPIPISVEDIIVHQSFLILTDSLKKKKRLPKIKIVPIRSSQL